MAYDVENTFKKIISSIEDGNSLRATLKFEGMPSSTTFYEWIDNDEQKALHYARACEKRADAIFEDIIDIADDASNDFTLADIGDGIQVEKFNSEHVQRSRLRVDARKWALSKMNPKKYGDKLDMTTGGDKIQSPPSSINVRIIESNDDE
jgi:hypothetical protein